MRTFKIGDHVKFRDSNTTVNRVLVVKITSFPNPSILVGVVTEVVNFIHIELGREMTFPVKMCDLVEQEPESDHLADFFTALDRLSNEEI